MDYINKTLSHIKIIEILIIFLVLYLFILAIETFLNFAIDEIVVYIGIILFVVYKLRNCKEDLIFKSKTLFDKFSFKEILIIVLLNIFFSYGMLIITHFLEQSFLSGELAYIFDSSILGISLLSSVVVAPIFEELLFRGIFLQRLHIVFKITTAILITSILFGIVHNFGGIISAIVFGICMCILYVKSQNILVPIFAHFLNNLFAETIVIIDYNNLIFTNILIIVIFSILAIISACFLAISIKKEFSSLK
ncbi:MAG: CPBP family intramembrane metalloprotease [Methanobacteriaceae archaeon]|jgi:hypothetical protein|nr:CPBP family intramembrane metalloprotease [Methanobacteriaceae archaeon]